MTPEVTHPLQAPVYQEENISLHDAEERQEAETGHAMPAGPILAMSGKYNDSGQDSLTSRFSPKFAWLPLLVGLALGLGIGVLVMHNRHESRKLVVAVNGTKIYEDQLFTQLQQVAGLQTMHQIVQEQLQIQFAKKKGLAPSDADVEARYAELSGQPGFAAKLAASNQTEASLKNTLRVQMAQAAVLSQGVTVSETEIHNFYAQQTDPHNAHSLFYQPDLIGLEAIAAPTQELAARALRELNAGTPFPLVVTGYSQDASKNNGGRLPTLQRGRSPLSSNPQLEQAVFNLNVGSRLGPVSYNHQWWIFQCDNKKPGVTLPYSKVKDECRRDALMIKGRNINGAKVNAEFQAFQQASNLQAFWPQYNAALGSR